MNENLNRKDLELAIQKTRDSFDTDKPVIPFIEGDGIGIDIWPASQRVFDAAVEKAYSNERKIEWQEVLAGQKAFDNTSEWLPEKTLEMLFDQLVLLSIQSFFCLNKLFQQRHQKLSVKQAKYLCLYHLLQ